MGGFPFPTIRHLGMQAVTDASPVAGMSLSDAIDQVSAVLEDAGVHCGHGALDTGEEAAWLVLAACNVPLDSNDIPWDAALTSPQAEAVSVLLDQRIHNRQPLAYLLGEAWFAGYPFYVDSRVLVPRSYFSEWIPERFEPWIDPADVHDVLDLCCGSGCIGIATALELPHARVTLSDVSADALAVAARNVSRHDLDARVSLRQGDGLAGIDGQFDLILCNPPYVSSALMDTLPAEYRAEPALGLAAGDDGLDFIRPLLREAPRRLKPGGVLMVEAGSAGEAAMAAWPKLPFTWLGTESDEPVLFMLTREELVAAKF